MTNEHRKYLSLNNFKKFVLITLFVFQFSSIKLYSQNLNGLKIYVSTDAETQIKFGSNYKEFTVNPKDNYVFFSFISANNKKGIRIQANNKFDTTILNISEGKNSHTFFLIYKANIPLSELTYDISDKNKIAAFAEKLNKENEASASISSTEKKQEQTNSNPINNPVVVPRPISETKQLEAVIISQEDIENLYHQLRTKANIAFSAKKWDESLDLYKQALKVKSEDGWCLKQIDNIKDSLNSIKTKSVENARISEEEKLKSIAYNNHIRIADSAFNKKAYTIARIEYNLALKEKQNDFKAASRIKEIDKAILEESYKSSMNIGKDYLAGDSFDNAELAFKDALKIKENDQEAKRLLAGIPQLRKNYQAQKKLEEKNNETKQLYLNIKDSADNNFEAGLLEAAKKFYKILFKINPNDVYAKKQLKKIDSINSVVQVQQTQRTKDAIKNANYQAAKKRGDDAFKANDFQKAINAYKLCMQLLPGDPYPPAQISQIEIMQTQIAENIVREKNEKRKTDSLNTKFSLLIKLHNAAIKKNEYDVAKAYITQALDINPNDSGAQKKAFEINGILEEIEKTNRYQAYIEKGDSIAFTRHNLDGSLQWYDSAIALKPLEVSAKTQYNYVNKQILRRDSIQMVQEKIELLAKNIDNAMPSYNKAEAARIESRNNADAYFYYAEFLSKVDTLDISSYSSAQKYCINNAKIYLQRLNSYKRSAQNNTQNRSTDNNSSTIQNPEDITILSSKYPDIDFTKPPPGQLYLVPPLDSKKQMQYINKEILLQRPRLNLMNNLQDKIRVSCQSINFNDDYIYLRFLIHNNDTVDFLTGPMLLSIIKKNEKIKQILPVCTSDFPVVTPGKEQLIVYAAKTLVLQNDESLVFDLANRQGNIRIKLNILPAVFETERKR